MDDEYYKGIASELLERFDLVDDKCASLLPTMTMIVQGVEGHKLGIMFHPLPSKTQVNRELKQLSAALTKVKAVMDKMDKHVLTAINRPLYEGELPLLDDARAQAEH